MSRIIIGDVHGTYKTLLALVAQFPKDVPITFCGDLIDRGPDSRSVMEFVYAGGHDCVLGNHEVMMITELKFKDGKVIPPSYYDSCWLGNGGDKCLDNYVVEGGYDDKTLKHYVDWLSKLPYHILYDEVNSKGEKLLVTHSTAAEVWDEYSPENPVFQNFVLWERNNFPPKIDGIFNVYGHTPQKDGPTIKGHFANIDTGAVFKRGPYGKLTGLQWPEMIVYEQEYCE